MDTARLLIATILVPLAGAGLMWVVAPAGRRAVRGTALIVTLVTLLLAGLVVNNFPRDGHV